MVLLFSIDTIHGKFMKTLQYFYRNAVINRIGRSDSVYSNRRCDMTHPKYPSCDIRGNGLVNGTTRFNIVAISADRVRIKPESPLKLKSRVSLDLNLDGFLYAVNVSCRGIVSGKKDNAFDIRLTGLTETDKTGINDIVRSSCDLV